MATKSREDRLKQLYAQLGEKREPLPRYDTPDSQNEALLRQQQVLGPTSAPSAPDMSAESEVPPMPIGDQPSSNYALNNQSSQAAGLPSGQIMSPEEFDKKLQEKKPDLFQNQNEGLPVEQADQNVMDSSTDAPASQSADEVLKEKKMQMDAAKSAEELPPETKEGVDSAIKNPGVRDYIKKKYGFGKELDDAALKATQENAAVRNLGANIGEGLAIIATAPSGQKVDSHFYDNLRGQAQQSVEDIKTRREGVLKDQGLEKSQKEMAREDALTDPQSPESIAVRDLYKKAYPDIVGQIPNFDKLSAKDAKEYTEKLIEAKQKSEDNRARNEANLEARKANMLRQQEADLTKTQNFNKAEDRRISGKELDAITDYTKALDKHGISAAVQTLNEIESIINKPEYKGDLPGYGIAGGAVPGPFASADAQRLRQLVQQLANIELKDRSGGAVTDPEYQRFRQEYGKDTWLPQREGPLLNKLSTYKRILAKTIGTYEPTLNARIGQSVYDESGNPVQGTARPTILEKYKQMPGAITRDSLRADGALPLNTENEAGKDPKIDDYAKAHGLDYNVAKTILEKRGYGG